MYDRDPHKASISVDDVEFIKRRPDFKKMTSRLTIKNDIQFIKYDVQIIKNDIQNFQNDVQIFVNDAQIFRVQIFAMTSRFF